MSPSMSLHQCQDVSITRQLNLDIYKSKYIVSLGDASLFKRGLLRNESIWKRTIYFLLLFMGILCLPRSNCVFWIYQKKLLGFSNWCWIWTDNLSFVGPTLKHLSYAVQWHYDYAYLAALLLILICEQRFASSEMQKCCRNSRNSPF